MRLIFNCNSNTTFLQNLDETFHFSEHNAARRNSIREKNLLHLIYSLVYAGFKFIIEEIYRNQIISAQLK